MVKKNRALSETDVQKTNNSDVPFTSKWANIPFSPAKCPFFYGWAIVAVSTLSIVFSIPGQTSGIGLFTDSLIKALAITRTQLSVAYMIGTITSGLLLPFAGKLLDRIGVRSAGKEVEAVSVVGSTREASPSSS